jgi:hypothetical protein
MGMILRITLVGRIIESVYGENTQILIFEFEYVQIDSNILGSGSNG